MDLAEVIKMLSNPAVDVGIVVVTIGSIVAVKALRADAKRKREDKDLTNDDEAEIEEAIADGIEKVGAGGIMGVLRRFIRRK